MTTFNCPTYSSELVIDLDALRANYRTLRNHVPSSHCGAVVKADAYGLGSHRIASALYREGCRTFFVAQLCEALELRAALPVDCTMIILNGLDSGGEEICADHGFVPVLSTESQVQRWRYTASTRGRVLPAGLQFETGMSRLGLADAVVRELADDPSLCQEIDLRFVMTHLACADEPNAPANAEQLRRFCNLANLFPDVPRSIANSCGATLSGGYHLDLVRPGIALYGVPFRSVCLGIAPVVSLRVRVLQVRDLEAGVGVGYGLTYAAPGRRRLATLGIGYADGWPRSLGNSGAAWHQDVRLPIVGRVSMDSMTVDISSTPPDTVVEGDFVELVGLRQSLDDIAADAGTIPYEILTRLGARHARLYVEDGVTGMLMPGQGR